MISFLILIGKNVLAWGMFLMDIYIVLNHLLGHWQLLRLFT